MNLSNSQQSQQSSIPNSPQSLATNIERRKRIEAHKAELARVANVVLDIARSDLAEDPAAWAIIRDEALKYAPLEETCHEAWTEQMLDSPFGSQVMSRRPETVLDDKSPMPFGKYGPKGDFRFTMQDVPPDYLDWVFDQQWLKHQWPQVYEYIARNRLLIDQELDSLEGAIEEEEGQ